MCGAENKGDGEIVISPAMPLTGHLLLQIKYKTKEEMHCTDIFNEYKLLSIVNLRSNNSHNYNNDNKHK